MVVWKGISLGLDDNPRIKIYGVFYNLHYCPGDYKPLNAPVLWLF